MTIEYPECPESTNDNRIQISAWKEAVKGDAECQYRMGWYYQNGFGVRKSRTKCLEWYSLAADQGHDESIKALGEIYWSTPTIPFEKCLDLMMRHCDECQCLECLASIYHDGFGLPRSFEKSFD